LEKNEEKCTVKQLRKLVLARKHAKIKEEIQQKSKKKNAGRGSIELGRHLVGVDLRSAIRNLEEKITRLLPLSPPGAGDENPRLFAWLWLASFSHTPQCKNPHGPLPANLLAASEQKPPLCLSQCGPTV
jgi:hypothetical protein